jgi:hypothetical protein
MRFALTALLWLCATVALAVVVPAVWTETHIVDVDGYTAMARNAARDKALQAAVACWCCSACQRLDWAACGRRE